MTTTDPAPRVRRTPSVRTKVVATVVALVLLALAAGGVATWAIQRRQADERIDRNLTRSVAQLRQTASSTTEGGVPEALRRALQQTVPLPAEGMMGLVDGRPTWYAPRTVPLRLEDDPRLVAALAGVPTDRSRLTTVTTSRTTYRVATVPVRVDGDARLGLYVLAADRDAELDALAATWRTYALVALGALAVVAVAGSMVLRRLLRPLDDLRETAQRITDTDLSERIPVRGTDDVAELTRTVNAMLDRLETSIDGQRRLLDDVGHELRTPLTVIGGHLEVMDRRDPTDVAATRELTLDEVQRMRLLVDDLLVLARTERPDFVRRAPTRIGVLTDDVLDKARMLGPRVWVVGERVDVECDVDPVRLTQAWLQLAENAVSYSEPGSRVTIGSSLAGNRLRLRVTDEGRGIDPEDVDRVFERFVRGRSVVDAGIPGSGLGLAIVAAIAAGHGGTVDLSSTPGRGTTVVLDLPVTPAAAATRPLELHPEEVP
ncbi:sensor histidine kinase [Phycicoccus sonneratiae]|uniref:histidine kinase n=1 Tax=Phycicoccus sonneratiae TaxID=2807628 RepID=A0ABS2CNA3_9MICO|nr:HAMP domain-containing sensor histidine kinase [Phycicoccus sonneraticus]MBM6401343.1 HAMP domain-containing histidine kinase [Phycicoccus sonneraticus]